MSDDFSRFLRLCQLRSARGHLHDNVDAQFDNVFERRKEFLYAEVSALYSQWREFDALSKKCNQGGAP